MRTLHTDAVAAAVADMCIQANRVLPEDVRERLRACAAKEQSPSAREVFRQLEENSVRAGRSELSLCQDTGLAVFFIELGQNLRLEGPLLPEAVNEGVRRGYGRGFLRKSVCDPFSRANTGDNTPAVIHTTLVPGDRLRIAYMAKGGGSENKSRLRMLTPSAGRKGIADFVVRCVLEAGADPCPPLIVGVGIGGSFDTAPVLAKKALLRPLDAITPDPLLAELEAELLERINALGIGPMGLGGVTTCLGVRAVAAPCHIASLPVAVNIQCHAARHAEVVL